MDCPIGENLFAPRNHHYDSAMMYYSWCAKTPLTFDMVCNSHIQMSSVVFTLVLSVGELIVHAILFVYQKLKNCGHILIEANNSPTQSEQIHIELQSTSLNQSQNQCNVQPEIQTDTEPDVTFPNVNQDPADHHYLISPMAHLIKAFINLLSVLPLCAYVFGMVAPNEGPIFWRDFIFFINPQLNFFIFPLVEIIYIRNLRTNLRSIISYENMITHIDWRLR